MQIEVTGTGKHVAYLEANAVGTEHETSDLVMSDPIRLFAESINRGFVVADGSARVEPRIEIMSVAYDKPSQTQRWHLNVGSMPIDHLRIAGNLLEAMGIQPTMMLIETSNGNRTAQVLSVDDAPWPTLSPPPPFGFACKLDPDDSIHSCDVLIEFEHPLTKDTAQTICAAIDVWAETVVRSGYAPSDSDPADAGTIPAGTYQHDERSIATGFEQVFAVDFACFETLKAYLSKLHRLGSRIAQVTIS